MLPLSLTFESTLDLASILNRQLNNSSILPLESGPLSGSIQIIRFPNIVVNLIKTSKKIAICADRSSNITTFSVDLSAPSLSSPIMAQGVNITRPSIFGFNSSLKDLDLHLDSCSELCSIIVSSTYLSRVFQKYNLYNLSDIFDRYNVFSSNSVHFRLVPLLKSLFSVSYDQHLLKLENLENDIISLIVECFLDDIETDFDLAIDRKERHQAALRLLSTASLNNGQPLEIQDLSELLHQSRTSIFNGCKEKFGMSPVEVVRSVRLHQVRHALINTEFCKKHDLNGVVEIADYFGFASRSHFSRYYKKHFSETPRESLASRRYA